VERIQKEIDELQASIKERNDKLAANEQRIKDVAERKAKVIAQ